MCTYASFGREIRHGQELTGVSINVGLVPGVDCLVLDLDNVDKGSRAVGPCEVLQSDRVVVPFTLELSFNLGKEALDGDGGSGGGDPLCEKGLNIR
jgi:hypothetical protein